MRQIFICYATGDENNVVKLHDALLHLEGIEVFVQQYIQQDAKNTPNKIKGMLDISDVAVVLLTFNSTNTMWLNQEIGYFVAKNIPIILLAERGIDIIGFLQGSNYITYQRGNFEQNIYEVISKLRSIFQHSESKITNFHVTCSKCKQNFLQPLPSQELVDKKLKKDEKIVYRCTFCSSLLNVNPMTLSTLE